MKKIKVYIKLSLYMKQPNSRMIDITNTIKSFKFKVNNNVSLNTIIKRKIKDAFESCYFVHNNNLSVKLIEDKKIAILTFNHIYCRKNENISNNDINELFDINWYSCSTGNTNNVILLSGGTGNLYLRMKTVGVQ